MVKDVNKLSHHEVVSAFGQMDERVFIALGSNLGNPVQQIDTAILAIASHDAIERIKLGKIYQSKPHGPQGQPDFLNTVLEIRTTLSPEYLLAFLHRIEAEQNRERLQHWGPRTIDLDIVLFGERVCDTETLTIPHPRAHEREFVLLPLQDIDNTITIPLLGEVSECIQKLPATTMKVIRDVTTYNC